VSDCEDVSKRSAPQRVNRVEVRVIDPSDYQSLKGLSGLLTGKQTKTPRHQFSSFIQYDRLTIELPKAVRHVLGIGGYGAMIDLGLIPDVVK
jgi:hypothetical protein